MTVPTLRRRRVAVIVLVAFLAVLAASIMIFGGDRRVLIAIGAGMAIGLAYLSFPRPVDRWLRVAERWALDFELAMWACLAIAALVVTIASFF